MSTCNINDLIEAIYDAGFDASKWEHVCGLLGQHLGGGVKVMMQGHDLRTRTNLGTRMPMSVASHDRAMIS